MGNNELQISQTKNPKKIFYLVSEYHGCGWYRCHVPGVILKKMGHTVSLNHFLPLSAVPESDVIIFQRQYSREALQALEYANQLGKLTVFELDDNIWHIDPTNPAYEFWSDERKLAGVEAALGMSKMVTTSTKCLADFLARFNPKVKVLPNMLPEEHWSLKPRSEASEDRLIVGWAGSRTHWRDLELLVGTVEGILDEYDFVEFHLAGMDTHPFREHSRLTMLPSVQLEDYGRLLSGFDIGLAPLMDTHFNRCKSDLKFIEYAMAGLAVVASRVEPYEKTVIHGETGLLARNPKDWLKYLRRVIESPELRGSLSAKARAYAQTRTISKNIWMWEEAYGLEKPATSKPGRLQK